MNISDALPIEFSVPAWDSRYCGFFLPLKSKSGVVFGIFAPSQIELFKVLCELEVSYDD